MFPIIAALVLEVASVAKNERAVAFVKDAVLDLVDDQAPARRAKASVGERLNRFRRLTADAEGEQKSLAACDVPADLLHLGGVLNEPARAASE
jgi:hypothetical protein